MRYRTRAGRSRPLALTAAAVVVAGIAPVVVAPVASAAVTCTVNYQVTNEWSTGFGASVAVRNQGDAVANWRLTWTFPSGQTVQQGWNGTFTQSGSKVTVAAPTWSPNLPSGGEVSVGFNGTKGAANAAPTDFAINGTPCTGPNTAPTVSLTSPSSGASYVTGAAIPLAATAADSDGTVAKVDFLADGAVVATDTSAPFQGSWTGASTGDHTLTARATDNKGATALSSPVGVKVLAGQAILASPNTLSVKQGATGAFGVSLATAPSGPVTVAVARSAGSTDLTAGPATLTFTTANWSTKQNVTVTSADNGGALAEATFTASATGITPASVAVKEISPSTTDFDQAFLDQYAKIHDPSSGYFRDFGGLKVPYHSVETLLVEAPDHGHQTTSEAFSYYLWLEASYARITGDWTSFKSAWASMEKFAIPAKADQPTNDKYNPSKPATYAPENPRMDQYPAQLDANIPVGTDPIAAELKSAYGTDDIYGMHWLFDVDNTYGFGRCGDGTDTAPAYINTYQRGSSESVWETIPHSSCDTFKHGGPNGFLDLFTKDASYAKQWKYTNAPDADARAVQVALLAQQWATSQGKAGEISSEIGKAAKMGDYLRYAMFDKYFKKVGGCTSPSCPAGSGKDSAHYLMSWYYAWGGATDTSAGWAWRIGDGASHQGYQNPLAAYALSQVASLKPKSATGQQDWAKSMDRQLELLQWLQSTDGGIAGGVTNSWEGHYGAPPSGTPTFYGMFYDAHPVWRDPPSNRWFGFQAWQMERTASLYQMTGDARAKKILDKWVPWALANTTVGANGAFQIPSDMDWTGTPDTWNPSNPSGNPGLRVSVLNHSQDVGIAASLAKTLLNYAAKSGNAAARTTGEGLLTALLSHQDDKGIATPESRADYNRFDDTYDSASGSGVYVPPGWTGKMPNGDTINQSSTFLSIRSMYRDDPDWPKVQAYLNGGSAPTFEYHRFWAQAEIATAFSLHSELFG
ncbi:cellulose binding domain-containing protein [Actinosynnema pretiosum subsp. pretiosum]|uniref:Glycoside hydrolase family 48 n=3 Tax=Actinosynnema TaxID=40566 RepID=C6WI69_ACTMD|nr:glycoside hydrolase family 48 protein [Actinosynnema mirum]ACU36112.1 glycoside hydrolase family 48 [Actinosynnema mirum DSM 43827]AXX29565.1 glycoside hydrolase, family 48 [Actinosynnema pretiosum subsp. pretiosum]QUF06203.1 cellulose binding domain-containing protein [Actinosynnema pretiosum subsp. pretiosum]